MTKETHTKGGLLAGLMTTPILLKTNMNGMNGIYVVSMLCIYMYATYFGSLLPDIDMKSSYISKAMPLVHRIFGKKLRHRGFTHSILAILIMFVVCSVIIYISGKETVITLFLLGLVVGYISHILLDLLTVEGVKLLYPSNRDFCFYNIKTSSNKEKKVRNFLKIAMWIFLGFNIHIILNR